MRQPRSLFPEMSVARRSLLAIGLTLFVIAHGPTTLAGDPVSPVTVDSAQASSSATVGSAQASSAAPAGAGLNTNDIGFSSVRSPASEESLKDGVVPVMPSMSGSKAFKLEQEPTVLGKKLNFSSPNPSSAPEPQRQASQVINIVRPSEEPPPGRVLAVFRTSLGNFTAELSPRHAPRSTRHFIDLAKGDKEFVDAKTGKKARRPFYNGLIFHRVMKNFLIQSGCPFGTGKGGPGFMIPDEFTPLLRHRKAGTLSLANLGEPNTNGSQFFITLGPQPEFDDKYTMIGEVIEGMDVVRAISRVRVGPTDRPAKRIFIVGIDIVEEGVTQMEASAPPAAATGPAEEAMPPNSSGAPNGGAPADQPDDASGAAPASTSP